MPLSSPSPSKRSSRAGLLAAFVATLTALTASVLSSASAEEAVARQASLSANAQGAERETSADAQGAEAESDDNDEPLEFDFVIVGGGAAAFAAYAELRAHAPEASILIVTEEDALPYARPPLSQALWREDVSPDVANTLQYKVHPDDTSFVTPALQRAERWDADTLTTLATSTRAVALDVAQHLLLLHDGELVKYHKLLLAPGAEPRVPAELGADVPALLDAGLVSTYRTYRDFQRLDTLLREPHLNRVMVLGGGPLGTELAYGLATRASQLPHAPRVTLVVDDAYGPLRRMLPPFLRSELTRHLRARGVDVRLNARVTEVNADEGGVHVLAGAEEVARGDHVVLALGVDPRVEVARESGLEVAPDGGVLASSELAVARDVWVAGDAASYWNPHARRRERVTHWEHARMSGRLAARNMLGPRAPRDPKDTDEDLVRHAQATWSQHWNGQIGPLHYEAVGELDSNLDCVAVWERAESDPVDAADNGTAWSEAALTRLEPPLSARRGVLYYLRERRVVGVLLWNMHNDAQLDAALLALKLPREYEGASLEALRRVVPFEPVPTQQQ